jgi:hypothetical protein
VQSGCDEIIYIGDYYTSHIRKIVYPNSLPAFSHAHTEAISVCANTALSLDTLLAITDNNSGQAETWSLAQPPVHGTASAAYTATSTGSTVTPSALTYNPATGYAGLDTLRVAVQDCGGVPDTITICITVIAPPVAAAITGPDTVCMGHTITLSDATPGGSWSLSHGHASHTANVITGVSAGYDTVRYIASNSCGSDTVLYPIVVKNCPSAVTTYSSVAERMSISPNPGNGIFTCALSSATNEEMHISITDLTGRKILETMGETNKPALLHVDGPAGIYFLSATTAEGAWSRKVIKN